MVEVEDKPYGVGRGESEALRASVWGEVWDVPRETWLEG